ncbi:MAG: CoA pyrophosphatase [Candidatus Obscuribacterales bacterium]|nr:CoA pyrophosphatase [Steroidobacteraceae bacterium]
MTGLDTLNLRQHIIDRLRDSVPITDLAHARIAGITPETAHLSDFKTLHSPRRAAVLIPIVDRPDGLTVLLTERAAHLKNHAGQISFPGGRLEGDNETPLEAALRETEEEIGLDREFITIAGYLESHLIFTGFHVVPVVGFVRPGFSLQPDPTEVADVFEVPLTHLLDTINHGTRAREVAGGAIQIYNIPYQQRVIWGATAGMVMSLYRLLI